MKKTSEESGDKRVGVLKCVLMGKRIFEIF